MLFRSQEEKSEEKKELRAQPEESCAVKAVSQKLSYAEQKEREKMIRRAQKKVKDCEEQIASLEGEIAALEEKMSSGEFDADIYASHSATQKKLDNAMSLWELASMELEELK